MKYVIRDDDTCFFTSPDDLERAYDFVDDGCISLSIIPYAVPVHKDDVFPYGKDMPYGMFDVKKNIELVQYLRDKCKKNKYDILLHGYSHEYRKINGIWQAEMIWKDLSQLQKELFEGKNHLEEIFHKKISVFVAPNNAIDQKAISVIELMNMNYSGIIQNRDRRVDLRYIFNFFKRWGYRVIKKIPYPGILNYGKHKELVAYTLDDFDRLVFEYHTCKKRKQPFVVYTHYWQLNRNEKTKNLLKKITKYVLEDGAQLVSLTSCFE